LKYLLQFDWSSLDIVVNIDEFHVFLLLFVFLCGFSNFFKLCLLVVKYYNLFHYYFNFSLLIIILIVIFVFVRVGCSHKFDCKTTSFNL